MQVALEVDRSRILSCIPVEHELDEPGPAPPILTRPQSLTQPRVVVLPDGVLVLVAPPQQRLAAGFRCVLEAIAFQPLVG